MDMGLKSRLIDCLRRVDYEISEFDRLRGLDQSNIEDVKKALRQVYDATLRALSEDENL